MLSSPLTWGLGIVYLENTYVRAVPAGLYKRVRFLSVFSISYQIAHDEYQFWFNFYSIIKVFSFSTTLWRGFSGLGDFVFNYISPTFDVRNITGRREVRSIAGRILASQQCPRPDPCNLWIPHFTRQRVFAETVKLRALKRRDYPRLFGWAQCDHKGP